MVFGAVLKKSEDLAENVFGCTLVLVGGLAAGIILGVLEIQAAEDLIRNADILDSINRTNIDVFEGLSGGFVSFSNTGLVGAVTTFSVAKYVGFGVAGLGVALLKTGKRHRK